MATKPGLWVDISSLIVTCQGKEDVMLSGEVSEYLMLRVLYYTCDVRVDIASSMFFIRCTAPPSALFRKSHGAQRAQFACLNEANYIAHKTS
jgi:hypothetical protein